MPFKNSRIRLEGLFGLALRRSYNFSNTTKSENISVKNGPFFELRVLIPLSFKSKKEAEEPSEDEILDYLDRDSDRLDF